MSARATVFPKKAKAQARETTANKRTTIARMAAAQARASAPVLTGAYKGGVTVRTEGPRVFLEDTDDTAFYKEYGTSDTPAHAALTDAARSYGRYSGFQPR